MPFNRPTLPEIVERIAADIESRLPGADARLRRSNLSVLARAEAGVAHGLYGYIDYFARQAIVDTADSEFLERWASVWGVARKVAVAAAGPVTFTGSPSATVPAGTIVQRADGAEFETTAAGALVAGTVTIDVIASAVGEAGNTVAGSQLALAAQVLGVSGTATVAAGGLVGGADVEADDDLRQRLLDRIRQQPQGGAAFDYETWALEVPGVTRAWIYPLELGPGTVTVRFVRDGDASILPDAGEVETVQAYIDARRPVTAEVYVVAPVALPVDITLTVTPDTADVRAAVTAELADMFAREAVPGSTMRISHINEAISLAAGEEDHVVTVPAGDIVAGAGEIPTLGVITWL